MTDTLIARAIGSSLSWAGKCLLNTASASHGTTKTMRHAHGRADDAADGGLHDGLDEELHGDVASLGAQARRMPISRVRSVTVASMMFMMPMPPTTSEIAAIMAEEHACSGPWRARPPRGGRAAR